MPAPPAAAAAAFDIAANASAPDALYPCSDGKPMAESISHGRAIMAAAGDLEAARPDALVAADILVYPEEGNPDNRIAPDVLAAFGLEKRRDRSSAPVAAHSARTARDAAMVAGLRLCAKRLCARRGG